jgi:hypothetical protein
MAGRFESGTMWRSNTFPLAALLCKFADFAGLEI